MQASLDDLVGIGFSLNHVPIGPGMLDAQTTRARAHQRLVSTELVTMIEGAL